MGRSRYKIYEPTHPHFLTCTILNWLPIFTRKESVQIIVDSLKYLQKENAQTLLEQFKFYKKAHKTDRTYQIWQEGYQPKLIQTDAIIKYIHQNPVKRGYVDEDKQGLIEVVKFW